jgi:hypothetical protein
MSERLSAAAIHLLTATGAAFALLALDRRVARRLAMDVRLARRRGSSTPSTGRSPVAST